MQRKVLAGYVVIPQQCAKYLVILKRDSWGIPISGLAHCTMKHIIEILTCWNYTQHMFYAVIPALAVKGLLLACDQLYSVRYYISFRLKYTIVLITHSLG